MKRIAGTIGILLILTVFLSFTDGGYTGAQQVSSLLTEEEVDSLLLMREEEKLARDVYTVLYQKWGLRIFSNIATSEQRHMDSVKVLLDRYGIQDPVKDNQTGKFTSPELAKLYDELVERGAKSLLDALIVGANIEELDIKDLIESSSKTDKADIKMVYDNLKRGSENHLEAFIRQITLRGGSYTSKYITE